MQNTKSEIAISGKSEEKVENPCLSTFFSKVDAAKTSQLIWKTSPTPSPSLHLFFVHIHVSAERRGKQITVDG